MTQASLEHLLRQVATAFDALGVPFALVGGFAVSVRAEPRFTRDVDIVVAVEDDSEAETLIRALRPHGLVPFSLVEQVATGRLATARLRNEHGMICDLLLATTGIEPRIVRGASSVELHAGLALPVASAEHLLAMKILSWDHERPQDLLDIRALLQAAPDLVQVRAALRSIEAAGAHRQQDLTRKLHGLLEE